MLTGSSFSELMKRRYAFLTPNGTYRYTGFIDEAFSFVENKQLLSRDVWARFVHQYKMEDADADGGWRGEFWGKMMRGACFVYSYTNNAELYSVLEETVKDMISAARKNEGGRISTYAKSHEFCHWDLWSRKYVMLGLEYFYEICKDGEVRSQILTVLKTQLDCIISGIGREEGKKCINHATHHWRGLNSSSILEPVMMLYELTGEPRYLDFATYIVEEGGTDVANIFELARKNELALYQYPVTKAYEMTSCFEGLLEYYLVMGDEGHKTALINYAERILNEELTVIGCAGCTHELFDHSAVRQANTNNCERMQETCVTVTLMKFFLRMHLLTGESKYVDAFERALYNAYLGAFNTEDVTEPYVLANVKKEFIEPLPFDSYTPLTAGTRGNGIGGLKVLDDGHYYGCCACIGSAGIGIVPKMHILNSDNNVVMNLFIEGSVSFTFPSGDKVELVTKTDYPRSGKVSVTVHTEKSIEFSFNIRIPKWSYNNTLTVNGEKFDTCAEYTCISRVWKNEDEIILSLDMRTEAMRPTPYGEQVLMTEVIWGANYVVPVFDREDPKAKHHVALRRGPIMLSMDSRLGYNVDDPINIEIGDDNFVDVTLIDGKVPYKCIVEAMIPLKSGKKLLATDCASAGKLMSEKSKMAIWMLIE